MQELRIIERCTAGVINMLARIPQYTHLKQRSYMCKMISSLNAGHSTARLLLDLSSAFDTFDYDILIHRKLYWFSISFSAFNLLSSFF